MATVNVLMAKTTLSKLIESIESGTQLFGDNGFRRQHQHGDDPEHAACHGPRFRAITRSTPP